MKTKELRALDSVALKKELTGLEREMFNLHMQRGSGQTVKTHLLARARRGIARAKTIMTEKAKG